jgi:hypothetical protein
MRPFLFTRLLFNFFLTFPNKKPTNYNLQKGNFKFVDFSHIGEELPAMPCKNNHTLPKTQAKASPIFDFLL